MNGIDISNYQGTINWQKVKADPQNIQIVIIKATEGLTINNAYMLAQYKGAKSVGMKVAFYHYLRANGPAAEANHFLSKIAGLPVDCLTGIDAEENLWGTKAKTSLAVRQFADILIAHGHKVCKYTSDSFNADYFDSTIANIPLWVAHPGVSKPTSNPFIGFQHSFTGKVNGIVGNVDLDIFSSAILLSTSTISNINSRELSYMFSERWYLKNYPDVAAAVKANKVKSGIAHYISNGKKEGRLPVPPIPAEYCEGAYLKNNPDVAKAVIHKDYANGIEHYCLNGFAENRKIKF